ncbi:triose-phosphate isomerase [SAR202 cluster bacterium AC-409-J13_OGT_754m]|nr:triose-phosphate isomerase [SAR202 cluster bacterium AC-409-J13_OGT_754m]
MPEKAGQLMVIGNWKMNTNVPEGIKLASKIRELLSGKAYHEIEVVLCPPFTSIAHISDVLSGSDLKLGAQNVFYEKEGPFTGEISARMLLGLCQFVIIGHSERRHVIGESNLDLNAKIKEVFSQDMNPILCVGETSEERDSGLTNVVVKEQIRQALDGVEDINGLAIAYEPVWAIGTGVPASFAQVEDVIESVIRGELATCYDDVISRITPVLYGGSVSSSNVAEFLGHSSIQGTLLGGASLDACEFVKIVDETASHLQ